MNIDKTFGISLEEKNCLTGNESDSFQFDCKLRNNFSEKLLKYPRKTHLRGATKFRVKRVRVHLSDTSNF